MTWVGPEREASRSEQFEEEVEGIHTGSAGGERATSQAVQVASTSVNHPQGAQERMLLVLEHSADVRPART